MEAHDFLEITNRVWYISEVYNSNVKSEEKIFSQIDQWSPTTQHYPIIISHNTVSFQYWRFITYWNWLYPLSRRGPWSYHCLDPKSSPPVVRFHRGRGESRFQSCVWTSCHPPVLRDNWTKWHFKIFVHLLELGPLVRESNAPWNVDWHFKCS